MSPVYVRTSNAPNPVSCLARSSHFSTCQRAKATVIICFQFAPPPALQIKYLYSSVLGFRSTSSQYSRSVGLDTSPEASTRCTRPALSSHTDGPRVVSLTVIRYQVWFRNTGLQLHTLSTRLGACAACCEQ